MSCISGHSVFFRWLLLPLLSLGLLASPSHGQVPLEADQIALTDSQEGILQEWRLEAANQTLRSGLTGLAADLYGELLQTPGLSDANKALIRLNRSVAYSAQQRYREALESLAELVPEMQGARYHLYWAIATYGDGRSVDVGAVRTALGEVVPTDLESQDMAWYYLLQGLVAEKQEQSQQAKTYFEQALDAAMTTAQKNFLRALIWRQDILLTPADPDLMVEVGAQLKKLSGQSAAFLFAKEYAVMLFNSGRSEEAIAAIDTELSEGALDLQQRDELLLIKGMIQGVDGSGRDTLRSLIENGRNREAMSIALQLLANAANESRNQIAFADFLTRMIDRAQVHSLKGEMHYLRSQMALAQDTAASLTQAEEDARLLLEQFPGLNQITDTFRILAYVALLREPPQYRAAADFLIQLRDQSQTAVSRKELSRLIGDCYFLNGDYANAVDFYQAARLREVGVTQDGSLFLRLITAQVRAGNVEAAMQHIDEADFGGYISVDDRWRAEWNVARELLAEGKNTVALERVRLLLEGSVAESVPAALDLRLRWLEARLSLFAGETDGVIERVDLLIARIESMPVDQAGSLVPEDRRLLITELLLLKASILFDSGNGAEGIALLGRLREQFPESSAAERSFIVESNYHASTGALESAQKILQQLVQQYPNSVLAPQAFFESAVYAEQRGPDFFEEAIRIYYDLAERYPRSELVFRAGLRQGDLLRQVNDFAAAQAVYENLINRFPDNSRRYVAELSRADCMLALAKGNASQLQDAALALERLIDLPNLPADVQIEIGYKWGFALAQRASTSEAIEVFTMTFSKFLLNENLVVDLGKPGRYWMARLMLDLGEALVAEAKPDQARRVYRKMVAYNLPGSAIAQSRASELQVAEAVTQP